MINPLLNCMFHIPTGAETGIDVTGNIDATVALQALLEPARLASPLDGRGKARIVVDLPNGADILISDTLHIYDPIHLRMNGSRIYCAANNMVHMLVIHDTAPRTFIEDGVFLYANPSVILTDNDRVAVKVEASRVVFRDVDVDGAGGCFNLDNESEAYNLNGAVFDNVFMTGFRRYGMNCVGVDASGHTLTACWFFVGQNHFSADGVVNNGYGPAVGLIDRTANGLNLFGCKFELTGSAEVSQAFILDPPGGTAPTTMVACYIEEGDVFSMSALAQHATAVGGGLALRNEWLYDKVGGQASHLTFQYPGIGGHTYTVRIPGGEYASALWWRADGSADDMWLLQRDDAAAGTYRWSFEHFPNQHIPILGMQAVKVNDVWTVDSAVLP